MFQTPCDGSDPCNSTNSAPPKYIDILESTIPGAGKGAFSSMDLWKGIRFGPYKGKITRSVDVAEVSGYSWQVSKLTINAIKPSVIF